MHLTSPVTFAFASMISTNRHREMLAPFRMSGTSHWATDGQHVLRVIFHSAVDKIAAIVFSGQPQHLPIQNPNPF
jgi:hypothetical protein